MKLNTIQKADFSAEYWDFTLEQDPITGINVGTHFFSKNIAGQLQTEGQTNEIAFYLKEQLKFQAQVRELKDRAGNYVYLKNGEPAVLYVAAFEPVFDVWGRVDGYRHVIQRG